MEIEKIDHLCIAVKDLKKAQEIYEDLLEIKPDEIYLDEKEKIKVAHYHIGEVALELMESTSPEGEVAKFIAQRGEGVFLLSFKVADVEKALAELKEKGVKLIDLEPRRFHKRRYVFIHPKAMAGVLIELIDGKD